MEGKSVNRGGGAMTAADAPAAATEFPRCGSRQPTSGSSGTSGLLPSTAEAAARSGGLPPALCAQRVLEYRARFTREYAPVGPTETAIVNDLALHALRMELWAQAAGCTERQAARALAHFASIQSTAAELSEDAVLAAALGSQGVERCDRQTLAHSKAFYRAQQKLTERQLLRK